MARSASDLIGQVCVVTGASRGIGEATARELARGGAHVALLVRDRAAGDRVAASIAAGTKATPRVYQIDLASLSSVRAAAAELSRDYPRIHALVNNAAIVARERTLSADGLELQFAVNHLAHFLLTTLLLPRLAAGAPGRVVNVSSEAHHGARLDFDDLQLERGYTANLAYSRSKLANILFTYELARREDPSRVTANCLHPGVIATKLLADYMGVPVVGGVMARAFGGRAEQGAETSVFLASSPEVSAVTGKYFIKRREQSSSPESYDRGAARRLWEASERLSAE